MHVMQVMALGLQTALGMQPQGCVGIFDPIAVSGPRTKNKEQNRNKTVISCSRPEPGLTRPVIVQLDEAHEVAVQLVRFL